jgi:peptide/nickel transport system substrate-binding protein
MNAVLAPRLARREFLGRLGPTALGLLAACALLPSAAAAQPPAAAQSSGTLTVGMVAEPTSMNPGQQPDQNSERIHSNIFDTLVAYDTQFNLQPSLATSWDVAPDGQTITFHLRDGVKFHDGSAFNAAAVKFTFDRMFQGRDPAFETTGPYPFANAYYGTITSIDAPDNLTAVFHLSRPDSVLLSNLTYTDAAIVSPTAFARLGKDVARNPVGTGPFKFNAWQNGVGVSLDGYPSYWGGAPGVSKLVFRPILEDQARVVELLSGGVNFIVDVPPDNIDQIKSDSGFKFDAQAGPHVWWLTLNVTKRRSMTSVCARPSTTRSTRRQSPMTS